MVIVLYLCVTVLRCVVQQISWVKHVFFLYTYIYVLHVIRLTSLKVIHDVCCPRKLVYRLITLSRHCCDVK